MNGKRQLSHTGPRTVLPVRQRVVLLLTVSLLVAFATLAMVSVSGVAERYAAELAAALIVIGAVLILVSLRYRPLSTWAEARTLRSAEAGALGLAAFGLASTLDLDQLLGMVAQQLCETLHVGRCSICLLDGDQLNLAATTVVSDKNRATPETGSDPMITARCATSLRDAAVLRPGDDGSVREAMEVAAAREVLVLPLLSRAGTLGVACLDEPGKLSGFSPRQLSVGMTIASFAALTVTNATLYRHQAELASQLGARSAQLEALLRLGNELRGIFDLDTVLERIGQAVIDTLGFREAGIYLYDKESDCYVTHVALGGGALDEILLQQPIPRRIFDGFQREEFRVSNSYFRSQRRAPSSPEEKKYFPATDLGERAEDEWQTDDTLLVPLLARDNTVLGLLDVYDPVDRQVPSLDVVRVIEVFANQAAIAIESALQYRQIDSQQRRLERQLQSQRDLLRVSESVLATLDEKVIFDTIADTLAALVRYDALSIAKVDERAGELVTVFARDEWADEVLSFRMKVGEGLSGWAVAHNEALLVNDVNVDPRIARVPGTPDEPQASIVVPLAIREKVIGVMCLDRLHGDTFEEDELDVVKLFANQAAIAIENAELYERSRQRAITDSLTGLFNHGYLQELIEREVKRAERYRKPFSLLMIDLDNFKEVNDRFGHQRGDKLLRQVATILRNSCRDSDHVARYGGDEFMVLLPETSNEDARRLAQRITARVHGLEVVKGERFRIAASAGIADYPQCGTDASSIVNAADTALLWAKRHGRDRCFYYRDIHELVVTSPGSDTLGGTRRTGIDVLAAAVDAKTSFREGHSESVSEMVQALAREIGLAQEEVELLGVAARLHDVGIIAVGVDILEKRGKLTPSEWREIRKHPRLGVDILASAGVPRDLLPAVLYHHERWDGGGYPEGLRGEQVPLPARVLAVCDAFQAMLSTRPYRPARTLTEAADELRREAGHQFDPFLVDVFLRRCLTSTSPSATVSGADTAAS